MFTVDVKGVLIGILLIALIVLVVFLIVLVSNLTDTVKKANSIIDSSTSVVNNVAAGVTDKVDAAKEKTAVVSSYATKGLGTVLKAAGRITKR